MGPYLVALFRLTLTEPRAAGRQIIALQLPVQALWMALALIAVVMSLVASGLLQMLALPEDAMGDMLRDNPAYRAPLIFALMQWGQGVLSVYILTWVGQIYGGRAALRDMLAVTVWIQMVIFVLGVGIGLLGVVLPPAVPFALLAYIAWAFWITIAMISVAHQFDNIFKGLAVIVTSMIAMLVGSAILAAVIGITAAAGV